MTAQKTPPPVLLVDDEDHILQSSKIVLRNARISPILTENDSRKVMALLAEQEVAVIVLDLSMPHLTGVELMGQIAQHHPEIPVIILTATQEVETAVNLMRDGAFDYLIKPVEKNRFTASVRHALQMRAMRRQMSSFQSAFLKNSSPSAEIFSGIVTNSEKMRRIFQYMEAIAYSDEPVLITGETGVGKELIARAMHQLSSRGSGPLISLNVAGLDDVMISDTLFGHRKGAFSGAHENRAGLVAQAADGTLFLDEIGDMKIESQVKLLRLIQENKYYPLGSDVPRNVNVRIIAATNQDLNRESQENRFRSDLYFRLATHRIEIPPLRERLEDIPLLVGHFLAEAVQKMAHTSEKEPPDPPPELISLLSVYHFPGNVRELRSLIYDTVAQHRSGPVLSMRVCEEAIRSSRQGAEQKEETSGGDEEQPTLKISGRFPTMKEAERLLVNEAMRQSGGNQGIAATLLGFSRQSLNRRLIKMKADST